MDADVGLHGPVFKKWHDSCLVPSIPHARMAPHAEEAATLVQALDDFRAGRLLELGDVLATRLRMLAYGLEHRQWDVARQFLSFAMEDPSLVPEAAVREALKMERASQKQAKELAAAGRGSAR